MSLRLKLNLLIAAVILTFTSTMLSMELMGTRRAVSEEIEAANRVATQLLSRVALVYANMGSPALVDFLYRLGRVRATEIHLVDSNGVMLYTSPPSPYKAGRDAPEWYSNAILPKRPRQEITLNDGARLVVEADASRAILDGWDEAVQLLIAGSIALLLGNGIVFWLVGRETRPFNTIVRGLEHMRAGDYHTRLPQLPGKEASSMAQAFNRMAQAIEDNMNARQEALEARSNLEENRELTQFIQSRIEEERRDIARELHDEMGQAVTAIKSMGLSIARRDAQSDPRSAEAANLIVETANHLYDVMHSIIPKLRPLALDNLGLEDALEDLVSEWRRHHPDMQFDLRMQDLPEAPGDSFKLAAYRIVQEAVTNALKHANARKIMISLHGSERSLEVSVEDDGAGLEQGWAQKRGHHGVRGMRERAQALGGELELQSRDDGGTRVFARLPMD
ncbi:ATP-binding protein [Methyloversatilis discipulorum]|uniref:ATP-binding protein n=1 Tax=Methyloversatilis discipulorum TaxID=1119528 RepID=UPI00036C76AF|nr:ATP-binding protein [Methyloversatilis discipulorum]